MKPCFSFDGLMYLDISFYKTPVHIKLDAAEPLLLSEGVCRQLGLISYHPSILVEQEDPSPNKLKSESASTVTKSKELKPETKGTKVKIGETKPETKENTLVGHKTIESTPVVMETEPVKSKTTQPSVNTNLQEPEEITGGQPEEGNQGSTELAHREGDELEMPSATVPIIRVRLLQTVKLLPSHSAVVSVKTDVSDCGGPLLIEYDKTVENATGLQVEDSIFTPSDGVACLVVTNPSGYTQVLGEGEELGRASEVSMVEPNMESTCVKMLSVPMDQKQAPCDMERCKKIRELMVPTDVAESDRSKLIQLLEDHNAAFSLEDGEQGETDVVELEIDTGDAKPRRQRARRMPFAIREEVSNNSRSCSQLESYNPLTAHGLVQL